MPFEGFDHVDARVRDLAGARPFYDAVMPALGLSRVVAYETAVEYYEPEQSGISRRFFGIHVARDHAPNATRLAFAASGRAEVDRLAAVVRAAGGRAVEGPEDAYDYEPYYAVFFEDPDGNKLEVCHRPGSPDFP